MSTAYIAIGSNLGSRIGNCIRAINEISGFAVLSAVSSIYETEPIGKIDQPYFINCAARIKTALSASDFLTSLKAVEELLGRKRELIDGPRTIDLDIIFYDDIVVQTEDLIIPHPRAHLRRFVLEPLCEIEPELIHPAIGISISRLLDELKDPSRVVRVGEFFTTYPQKSTAYPQV